MQGGRGHAQAELRDQPAIAGRAKELAAVLEAARGGRALYVHGPGGVGKTSLLGAAVEALRAEGLAIASIDGRDVECTPHAFLTALARALGEAGADPLALLTARAAPVVVLVDSYEKLAGLDGWLRREVLTALPRGATLVLAGRMAPSAEWRSEPGWNDTLRALPLANLSPADARALLTSRGVAERHHARAIALTHGHPLAICLVADLVRRRASNLRALRDAPDVVQALLERFLDELDEPRHRAALEVTSLVRNTTEPLLAALLGGDDAHALMRWLARLSLVELGPQGLFPHDLARDVLRADLAWRNPDRTSELLERASGFYATRLHANRGGDPFHLASELLFLHSNHPVVAAFTPWAGAAALSVEPSRPSDAPALVHMVLRHEGRASAAILGRWLERQPRAAIVVRDTGEAPAGFTLPLRLDHARPADLAGDLASQLAWRHVEERGHRRGHAVLFVRFLMSRDEHQGHSPIMSILGSQSMRLYLTTPDLDWAFTCMTNPEAWKDALEAAFGAALLPPFEIEGRRYGVFVQCFRDQSPGAWLAGLARRGVAGTIAEPRRARVLDRREMTEAVRAALRALSRPHALAENPLASSTLLDGGPLDTTHDRPASLVALLTATADLVAAQAGGERLRAALQHTYFDPRGGREEAARRAGMTFGTYRRTLARAIDEVVELLLHRQRTGASSDVTRS